MKKAILITFALLFAFLIISCKKKRYPSDIPGWLRKKIEAFEKETKKYNNGGLFYSRKHHTCPHVVARMVDEYFDGSSTYYWIGSGYNGYTIYNCDGIEVYYGYGNYTNFVRNVWIEDCG